MGIDKNILKNTDLILFNMEGKKNITNNNMRIQIKNYVGQPNFNAKLEIFKISEKTTLQNMDKNKPKYSI